MPVTLKNITARPKKPLLLQLTRQVAPVRHLFDRVHQNKDGTATQESVRLVLPDSLSLQPGEERKGLPDSVRSCPDVEKARAAGELSITDEKDEPSAKASEETAHATTGKASAKK